MIILDTNVVSVLMHVVPDTGLLGWLDRQPNSSIWTTSVTVMEIRYGFQILPPGRRREILVQAFETTLEDKIEGRIAPFDTSAAEYAANLMAMRRTKGRPVELTDSMIAGIVLSRNAALATRNTVHFEDLGSRVVDPWNLSV
jgi:toxin FitB